MKNKHIGFFVGVILVISLILSACSQSDVNSNQAENVDGEEVTGGKSEENEQITLTKDTILVGSTLEGPPHGYVEEGTQETKGVLIDIIKEIGNRLKYEVQYQPMDWASLIPALENDKIDVIVEGMYITDERKEQINFTEPISRYGEGLVVHKENDSINGMDDLKDKKVGAQIGTVYLSMLEEMGITDQLKTYDMITDMLMDLTHKRIDAVIADEPMLIYFADTDTRFNVKVIDSYESRLPGDVGIGVNKNNEALLNKLNEVIQEMKADGTLKSIHEKYNIPYEL